MIKLVVGTALVLLFLYCIRLIFKMSRVAAKQKELADVIIEEEVENLEEQIEARREKLYQKKHGEEVSGQDTKTDYNKYNF